MKREGTAVAAPSRFFSLRRNAAGQRRQRGADLREHVAQRRARRGRAGDDGQGNQCDDEAVFEGVRARVIRKEAANNFHF